jgi:uncharacterized protein DUF2752
LARLLAIGFLLSLFLLCALVPPGWVEGIPLCLFHYLTGWDCPGCGLTRAFFALFHGNFSQAIRFNAMAPVLVLWFAIYLADHSYTLLKGYRPRWFTTSGSRIISRLFVVLFLGQWIFKSSLALWEHGHLVAFLTP